TRSDEYVGTVSRTPVSPFCWIKNSSARTRVLTSTLISSPSSTHTARSPAGRNRNASDRRQRGVWQVRDEHVPRAVRDHERRPRRERDGLGRDAARPENRYVAARKFLRVAPVGARDVRDADGGGIAHVHGGAVGAGESGARRHRLRELRGRD